jgi:hypothetical protein
MKKVFILLLLTLAATSALSASTNYLYVETDQTGANTQIDANHTSSWNFTALSDWVLGGGLFTMKQGSKTSLDIYFTLSTTGSADVVLHPSITGSTSQFTQQWGQINFSFTPVVTLIPNAYYTLTLHSTSPDTQSQAYFIKGNTSNYGFETIDGTPLDPSEYADGFVAAVPEPGTWLLAAGGIGLVLFARRRIHA